MVAVTTRTSEKRVERIDELLRSVAKRDRAAFHELYDVTSDMVFGICARMLRSGDEAEDLTQEIYVTIWRKAGHFDNTKAGAFSWIASIARNRAIDRLRRRPASDTPKHSVDIDHAQSDQWSPAQLHEIHQERAQLDDCVDELDERGRMLIRTAFYDGLTYEQLAERTGNPLGSVKTWIRRGLAQLRECLQP